MRDIEFRVWDKVKKRMYEDVIGTTYMDELWWDEDCIKMQYSGLNDSAGSKIFEDDIVISVITSISDVGKVIFKDGEYSIDWGREEYDTYCRLRLRHKQLIKIGNIYEIDGYPND